MSPEDRPGAASPAASPVESAERRARSLVESLREPVFQCDADGRLVYVNPAWTELTGYDAETSRGCLLHGFFEPHDADRLRRFIEGGDGDDPSASRCTGRAALRSRGGDRTIVEASIQREGDRFHGSLFDVSRHEALTRELVDASQAAEAANRAKSVFLANMSHELRTPLAAILGFAEALGEVGTGEEDGPVYLERILGNARHVLALVNDLLDYSQVEAGRLSVVIEPLAVHEIVAELAEIHAAATARRGVALTVSVDPAAPELVYSDPVRLRQILANLIGNAVKFTRVGRIDVRVLAREDGVAVEVEDTGPGIAPDDRARVFEPFQQSNDRDRAGGAGLGLAIAKRLATHLGAELGLESEVGEGCRFRLAIPRDARIPSARRRTPSVAPTSSVAPARVAARRVLLAEDTEDMVLITTRYLHALGLEVTVAKNGLEAIAAVLRADAEGRPFELILMDMQMPECNGYEATARLRDAGCDAPIVAVTAHAMANDRQRCLDAGCTEYLAKPISKRALQSMVRTVLGEPPA